MEIGAKNAYVPGYHVAGKTGTSVKTDQAAGEGARKNVVASFGGFAPPMSPVWQSSSLSTSPRPPSASAASFPPRWRRRFCPRHCPIWGWSLQYTEEEITSMNRAAPDVTGSSVAAAQNQAPERAVAGEAGRKRWRGAGRFPGGRPCPRTARWCSIRREPTGVETTAVPNFVGMTLAEANSAAVGAGLNLIIAGLDDRDGQAVVRAQSVEAETDAPPGTVVRIDVLYQDTVE